MFMETYRIVDQGVKVRMEELLNTWRSSGPGGRPLFGEAAQWSIESALYGSRGPPQQSTPSYANQQPHAHANVTVTKMLDRFDRLLATSRHFQQYNPHLFDATRHDALTKLRALVASTALSQIELSQIESQLSVLEGELRGPAQNNLPTPQHISTPLSATLQHSQVRNTPPLGATQSPVQNAPIALPPALAGALANLGKLTPPQSQTPPTGTKPAQTSALDLVTNLRLAGLLPSSSATPEVEDQDAGYCKLVSGLEIKLTTMDLQRDVPLGSLDSIMHRELPLQCKQCANRYPSGPKGQASLDKHLDWHFRQNRRAKDSLVRGQSRAWSSKMDEWVRGGHDDTVPAKRQDNSTAEGGAVAGALTPAQEAELKEATKAFVVAPSDDPDAATKPCPVCKEVFTPEWSEDEEDFIWKNCVLRDGVYYHGSCYFSAKTLRRVKTGPHATPLGSREGTPQMDSKSQAVVTDQTTSSAQPVPSVLGVKRKSSPTVKEEGSEDETENPSKKLAKAEE